MELRPYQVEIVRRALAYPGFGIFCEQRTGKTLIALSIAQARKPRRLLIVCPKIAIPVWESHLAKSELTCEVRILTYQSLWPHRHEIAKWAPQMIIADESHKLKGHMTYQSRALRFIGRRAQWRLALTGTPIAQGYQDAWAQMDFIDPTVFGRWRDFKERYLIYGGFENRKIVGYRNTSELIERFNSRFFRVTLDEVQGKRTVIRSIKSMFDLHESKKIYREMEKDLIATVNESRIVSQRVITQVLKLQQITGGFIYDTEEKKLHRVGYEKINRLLEIVSRIGDEPFVVFVRFLWEMEAIENALLGLGITSAKISGKHQFNGDFSTRCVIVQIQSGMSIDLARASIAIFYSLNHSYLDLEQAKFRIRSFGKEAVTYYFLLARGTVDEDIYAAVKGKRSVAVEICDKYRRAR
ncbi:MAG: DEAD/DEAH box helicase [Thermosphaera sp.]